MNLIISVVRTKTLAIVIGTTGLGILSQFYNISGLLFAIIPIGTMGLLKYISKYSAENEFGKVSYLLKFFFWLNLPIVIIISLFFIVFPSDISHFLFSDSSYSYCIFFYAFAIPLGMAGSLTDTYYRGLRDVKLYVILTIVNSIVGFIIFITLIVLYSYEGAVISISLSSLMGILLGYFFLKKRSKTFKLHHVERVNKTIIKDILKLGVVMMFLVALQQVTFLFIRSTMATHLGLHEVGIFQSVYGISNNYFALFLGVLGTYSIPLISTHKDSKDTVIEINRTLKLLLLVYTPLVILCFTFRFLLIKILYSDAFLEAGDILFYQLLGDFVKAISWVFGLWLIPYIKITLLMIFEIINNIIFSAVFYYLLIYRNYGVESASIAYLCAFVIHMILNFLYLKKGLNYKFENKNLKSLIVSFTAIVLIFLISMYNTLWGYYLFAVVILIWGGLIIKKSDLLQLKDMLIKSLGLRKRF